MILDGFAVRLPYRDLPKLFEVAGVRKVYPSLRYHLDTNKSPSVIRADTFWANTGGFGQGIKIGVVDDGVDKSNPFFSPAGFSYPRRLPEGRTKLDDAEGDRRARLPRAGLRAPGPARALTGQARSTARTSPGSPPASRAPSSRPAPTIRR